MAEIRSNPTGPKQPPLFGEVLPLNSNHPPVEILISQVQAQEISSSAGILESLHPGTLLTIGRPWREEISKLNGNGSDEAKQKISGKEMEIELRNSGKIFTIKTTLDAILSEQERRRLENLKTNEKKLTDLDKEFDGLDRVGTTSHISKGKEKAQAQIDYVSGKKDIYEI